MKACFKCGKVLPLSMFYKHSAMKDGHVNKCKFCNRVDVIVNRLHKIDYYRAYDVRRNKEPHRKANDLERHRKDPKEKAAARAAVQGAIRRGEIIRPDVCARCGNKCKPDGHHDDHLKQLEVLWLCRVCHAARHAELGRLSHV